MLTNLVKLCGILSLSVAEFERYNAENFLLEAKSFKLTPKPFSNFL